MKTRIVLFSFLIGCCLSNYAQDFYDDYSFFRSQSLPVIIDSNRLSMPWAGGMNSVRFSEIDLDGDGVNDLFAFEKHGNRILTFLRRDNHYIYDPEYVRCFPALHDWAILKDYNNDGKPDIFTYGQAGITVYKNVGTSQPRFQRVTSQLQAFYYNNYVNIYASPDDYLVIDDIDRDGHLDILNFWVLGKYVHHLRNYSDNPEVFDFRLESECWGHFEEAADNNAVTLFSDCNRRGDGEEHTRHVGSSMLLHDFDGNGLPDVLIGDVDSPNLILLHNTGTITEARMTQQDTAFPVNAPVQIYSMPAPSLVTLPGQNEPSLVVSPSDPSLAKSQDLNSVWRYDYDDNLQQYTLNNTAFLQEDMIDAGSGCHPVLYDWNQDGLLDLFLSNYGSFDSAQVINGFLTSYFSSSIQYYENVGTATEPAFELRDRDFGHLKALNYQALHPTFGDFDGDGLTDMLCGQKDGTLILIPHQRIQNGTENILEHYQNIDVGEYSTPQYFDLDDDGHEDLLIGNRRGLLSYYHNNGTSGPASFTHVTDTLGNVDVCNHNASYFGYSVPCFHRDTIHSTTMVCGSEQGFLYYYPNINNAPLQPHFGNSLYVTRDSLCSDHCTEELWDGKRTAPAFADINGDNYPDLIIGHYAGGVTFYKGRFPHFNGIGIEEHTNDITIFPNPTTSLLNIRSEKLVIREVRILDISGRTLFKTNHNIIDLSALPSGIYLVEINHSIRKKVVKL